VHWRFPDLSRYLPTYSILPSKFLYSFPKTGIHPAFSPADAMYLAPHSACHNRHQNNTDRTDYALTQSYGENTASLSALRITSIIDFEKNGNPFFRFYRFFSIASIYLPVYDFSF